MNYTIDKNDPNIDCIQSDHISIQYQKVSKHIYRINY